MDQIKYNYISIVLTIIGLATTIIGLIAVFIQIKKVKNSIWGSTHSQLCDQSFELIRFLNENPVSYDYFYDNKELSEDAKEKVYILYAAEAIANFMEHLVLQKGNLPVKQWEVWHRFICSSLESSVVLKKFIVSKQEWYSSDLLRFVKDN